MTAVEFSNQVLLIEPMLYRVAYGLLLNRTDCADAVQEALLRAWEKRNTLRDESLFRTWLTRILINECYSIHRRAKWERPSERLPEPPPMPGPDADPEVFRILFSLNEKLRLPMVLHYVEGYSVDEVARIMRIPTGTVKSRLARAREKMHKEMKEAGEQ